jgi:hypothetical protein
VLGLSQKAYLEKVLKKFNMYQCKPSPVPIVKGDKFGNFQSPRNQYEIDQMKSVLYASAVRSLMYAQVCTRPDIAFATGMFGRFQKNPGPDHWKGIKKALRYLQGTKGLMLTYRISDTLEIVGYSDSDFAGYKDTEKSTSGYVFLLAGGAISWKSSKQTVTTSSTMYAEFVACYEATGQAMWLKNIANDGNLDAGAGVFEAGTRPPPNTNASSGQRVPENTSALTSLGPEGMTPSTPP